MHKLLLRHYFLLLSLFLLQNIFSQDMLLKTATDSISLSGIISCKEPSCISYSVKVVTNAIKNARSQTDDILSVRDDLQDKIKQYNQEVTVFYKTVDSLGDLYAKNQKALDEYAQDRKNFQETYRFVTSQPTLASLPPAGTSNRSNQGSMPAGNAIMPSTYMGNINSRMQKDIDEKNLSEKGRRLNSEHRIIDDNRKTLERQRTKLLAEGNYLNEMLKKNTDNLAEANKRMIEVTAFGKKVNTLLVDELKFSQKLDADLLSETELFSNTLAVRIHETQAIIVNILLKK